MSFNRIFAQFRSEVIAYVTYILEDKDYVIDCVVRRAVIVIGIGQMLEES